MQYKADDSIGGKSNIMELQNSEDLQSQPASIDDVLTGNFHGNKNGEVKKKRETKA